MIFFIQIVNPQKHLIKVANVKEKEQNQTGWPVNNKPLTNQLDQFV